MVIISIASTFEVLWKLEALGCETIPKYQKDELISKPQIIKNFKAWFYCSLESYFVLTGCMHGS